ncbi:MAG: hypothetical protein H6733_02645 [Alphaproteobacteria bacterium]|nr:hypothetical protein [Alphaproteobacteria bacterium]
MSPRKLLEDLAHAIRSFVDMDDDNVIEVWDRVWVFRMDAPATSLWADMPCADNPPRCYHLMTRTVDGDRIYDLLWAKEGESADHWPVVEVSEHGDGQVVALSASDWIDALLYTGGMLGGGSEDDLEAAREEASNAATSLADELLDELDRDLADAELLGERCEDAVERHGDAWSDAVEGIDG